MGDGMEPGQHDTDAAEARRIAARKAVADRKARDMRDQRLADMEAARGEARNLKAKCEGEAAAAIGEVGEEVNSLTSAVRWLAAETRAQRIEVADRAALNQELGRSFRQEGEVEDALQRAREGETP